MKETESFNIIIYNTGRWGGGWGGGWERKWNNVRQELSKSHEYTNKVK